MKNSAILQLSAKYQVAQTVVILAATMALPVLVHLLPNINGNLSGAVLLPIFIAPMLATFIYKKHVAIFAGIFAPLLNYLLMGRPAPEMVITLGFEVVAFVLLLSWLKNLKGIQYLAAPLSFLLASLITMLGLSVISNAEPVSLWLNSTAVAIPGILLLAILNIVLMKFKK
ncbi:MAG: hypothetical protein JNL03_09285 [Prolixibacteraceae bacterium]|nr:hypothetical protein [Prolixibacteraceae bacterium]